MKVRADTEQPGWNHEMRHASKVIKKAMNQMHAYKRFEVSLLLSGEERIRDLNSRYRKKDEATDVLAFPMMSRKEIESVGSPGSRHTELIGDIVICVPVAKNQAEERGVSLNDEIELLAVHGLLHLYGYDHSNDEEEREMSELASKILKREV